MEHRFAKLRRKRGSDILVAEGVEFFVEQAQAEDLDLRARVAIHHDAGLVFRI